MEQHLVLFVSLVLVSLCRAWVAPDFCHSKPCPEYKVIETTESHEERVYAPTTWITTKIDSKTKTAIVAASSRLKEYCRSQNKAGYEIPEDTWPVLITIRDGNDFSLSWFVPPDTTLPEPTDSLVTIEHRPETTVYVRVFDGYPSIEGGEENAGKLWKELHQNCDLLSYTGAGYDGYFSLQHHNEIWINTTDLKCYTTK